MTVNNEMAFKEWFKTHTHDGGKPYESSTRNYYITALRTASKQFSDLIKPYKTIFDISDITEFKRVREEIELDKAAKEYIDVYAHGCLRRCFEIYQDFLEGN